MLYRSLALSLLFTTTTLFIGCADSVATPEPEDNEQEVITTVELTFTDSGGAESVFTFADPEDDGDPVIDDIVLPTGADFDLSVRFLNELESPAEDITEEVDEESHEHQIFIFGSAVDGPATDNAGAIVTHTYADTDSEGLPVGLDNSITTNAVGNGEFSLILRHLPVENDSPLKVEGLAGDFASGGEAALPGDSDVNVTFRLEVE